MVDIVSALSLQARSRRNAKKALWLARRQREERAAAARALAAADGRGVGLPVRTRRRRTTPLSGT